MRTLRAIGVADVVAHEFPPGPLGLLCIASLWLLFAHFLMRPDTSSALYSGYLAENKVVRAMPCDSLPTLPTLWQ